MQRETFAPLCVLLAEAAPQPPRRTPGWPDAWFIRGKIPMTKRQVRVAILAALNPGPGEVFWDVGAGTGSVSVELAAASQGGTVYAVECEEPAMELIRQNREKFHVWNVRTISGRVPRALEDLPAPDAVFCGGQQGRNERNPPPCAEEKSRRSVMCELHCPGNAGNSPGILP